MNIKKVRSAAIELHQPPLSPFLYFSSILVFTFLNLLMSYLNTYVFKTPFFLDSIFTAVSGVIYGPVSGVLTGLLTNLGEEPIHGMAGYHWPFAICNMFTGLVAGLMSRRGYFSSSMHIALAVIIITLGNAVFGAFLAYFVYSGNTNIKIDYVVSAFVDTGQSLFSASFWARIPTNLIDKMIAVYVAFGFKRFVYPVPE